MNVTKKKRAMTATCFALLLTQLVVAATVNAASSASEKSSVQVVAQVDRNTAQVAEPIRLTVKAKAPTGVRVSFPEASDRLGDFDVISADDQFDIPVAKGRTSTRTYVLESLTPGSHTIPAIGVTCVDSRSGNSASQSTQQVIESQPVEITITSLLEGETDPTKFRDIKGIVAVAPPEPESHQWLIGVAATALLAVVGLAALYYLKRERLQSAREWAIAELERLGKARQGDQVNAQDFYIQVTDIVRQFIERRFHIAAPRLTTAEFFQRVKHNQQLACCLQPLRSFLTTADMVKFAGVQPQAGDCEAAIAKARQFVEASVAPATDSNSNKTPVSTRVKETA